MLGWRCGCGCSQRRFRSSLLNSLRLLQISNRKINIYSHNIHSYVHWPHVTTHVREWPGTLMVTWPYLTNRGPWVSSIIKSHRGDLRDGGSLYAEILFAAKSRLECIISPVDGKIVGGKIWPSGRAWRDSTEASTNRRGTVSVAVLHHFQFRKKVISWMKTF